MAKTKKTRQNRKKGSGATLDFKAELWAAADALRGSMDAAEYKHVALSLIFLKYISDAFEEAHAKLETESDEGANPETPMSTGRSTFSGSRQRHAGHSSRLRRSRRRSVSW